MFEISISEDKKSTYVKLNDNKVEKTIQSFTNKGLLFDYDKYGELVGIEMLGKINIQNTNTKKPIIPPSKIPLPKIDFEKGPSLSLSEMEKILKDKL